jgi:NADPH2:quinone reductase
VTPVIFPDVVPLERLGDGLTALENRKTWGKVIVKIKEDIPFARL